MPEQPHISEAYVLDRHHAAVDDGNTCAICGDDLEAGQKAIEVPFDGVSRWQVTVHLGCAINQNEVDL